MRVDEPVDLGPPPSNVADATSPWWRHEVLHRAVMADPAALLPRYAAERDRVEAEWRSAPPSSSEAFERAATLTASWTDDVLAGPSTDRRPGWVRRAWRRWDRAARMDRQLAGART